MVYNGVGSQVFPQRYSALNLRNFFFLFLWPPLYVYAVAESTDEHNSNLQKVIMKLESKVNSLQQNQEYLRNAIEDILQKEVQYHN